MIPSHDKKRCMMENKNIRKYEINKKVKQY